LCACEALHESVIVDVLPRHVPHYE
jgi:hypothetical protein